MMEYPEEMVRYVGEKKVEPNPKIYYVPYSTNNDDLWIKVIMAISVSISAISLLINLYRK